MGPAAVFWAKIFLWDAQDFIFLLLVSKNGAGAPSSYKRKQSRQPLILGKDALVSRSAFWVRKFGEGSLRGEVQAKAPWRS